MNQPYTNPTHTNPTHTNQTHTNQTHTNTTVLTLSKISLFVLLATAVLFLPAEKGYAAGDDGCKSLENIFQTKVESRNGVCQLELARNLQVTHYGMKLSPDLMELALLASFEKVKGQTVVMGEFALLENEVNPVIDAFRKGNIEISALHNHMIGEHPRIIFLHFQGKGDLDKLAKTVKSAIDKTGYPLF